MAGNLLTYKVETSFNVDEALRSAWDHLAVETGSPVYMSYDWLRLWWDFYGKGHQLRLFVFSNGESLVGILPMYLSSVGMWPLNAKVGRLVGANIPPKVFDPPIIPEWASDIWKKVTGHLFNKDGCDIVSLGPLSETYGALEALSKFTQSEGSTYVEGKMTTRDVHTVYHLPKSFEQLMHSLDAKERKVRRKKLRDLENKGPIRVEVIKDPALVEGEFESFVRQHTIQWEAEGRPGHFHAWPKALEFNRQLVKLQGKLGRVRFIRLMVGDLVIANQYSYAFGGKLFAELPSRIVGDSWDRFSLGCSSQVKLLETSIAEGFEAMESGLGHYDYKVLLGGREYKAVTLRLHAKRIRSRFRGATCMLLRGLLVFLLNKIWYKRICPYLPKAIRSGQVAFALAYDF